MTISKRLYVDYQQCNVNKQIISKQVEEKYFSVYVFNKSIVRKNDRIEFHFASSFVLIRFSDF